MVHPAPNGLVGYRDAALRQQIFDVAKTQGESEIEPDRVLNDLRREPLLAVTDFLQHQGFTQHPLTIHAAAHMVDLVKGCEKVQPR